MKIDFGYVTFTGLILAGLNLLGVTKISWIIVWLLLLTPIIFYAFLGVLLLIASFLLSVLL